MSTQAPEPGERCRQAIGSISDYIYLAPQEYERALRQISPEQAHLLGVYWLHCEVCNGGFHQFFWNPTGIVAPEAALGLRALGLGDFAALVEEALTFWGTPYPRECSRRQQILDAITGSVRAEFDPFFKLDDPFYELLDAEPDRYWQAADEYARRVIG